MAASLLVYDLIIDGVLCRLFGLDGAMHQKTLNYLTYYRNMTSHSWVLQSVMGQRVVAILPWFLCLLMTEGPPDHAMWALGDKIAATIMAQSANVPTLPWSGSGLQQLECCRWFCS